MVKYLIFKDGVHVATCFKPEEVDELYLKFDADDVREYEDEQVLA